VVSARAEELPLVGGHFDAVVGSSMWHWVDAGKASVETARVLRPGGVLGLVWAGPDRSQPWLATLLSIVRPEPPTPARSGHGHRLVMGLSPEAPFSEPEAHTLRWSLSVTPGHLVELACTYSAFIVLPESERTRLRGLLVDAVADHAALTDDGEIELPMRGICWRAVRSA
jgi:SAM-dependent methyltransferase